MTQCGFKQCFFQKKLLFKEKNMRKREKEIKSLNIVATEKILSILSILSQSMLQKSPILVL